MSVIAVALVFFTGLAAAEIEAADQRVEVTRLSGDQLTGSLRGITTASVTVDDGKKKVELPLAELMGVRFAERKNEAVEQANAIRIELTDGSRLTCSQITTSKQTATLNSDAMGTLTLPTTDIESIRFAKSDAAVADAWKDLTTRSRKTDSLVVVKQNDGTAVLDRIDGVVGAIDEKSVQFLYDGDQISVNREKLFGVVFYRRETESKQTRPNCRVVLMGQDMLHAKTVTSDGLRLQAGLTSGSTVSIGLEHVRQLDFSSSKVSYLSTLEPRDVKYTPYFDVVWEYRRDTNLDGGPLRLGHRTYARGLALHSKTFLQYRLAAEYRRFQAVMGIDELITNRNLGHVHVVISGDGKTLLETDVRGADEPRSIDLNVQGVRDLGILVDFGEDLDIADHLDLANARVIK